MSKLFTLGVAAVAYVLGAKAGRDRYDQIVSGAQKIKSNPKVQSAATDAKETIKEHAPEVKDKAAGAVKQAASKVKSSKQDDTTTVSPNAPGEVKVRP
jgi:hypothetical protein